MRVSELYHRPPFLGASVFIVGSGPSLTVFPESYLKGELCILLNDTWRYRTRLGPVVFSNNKSFLQGCRHEIQIVKSRLKFDGNMERDDNHVAWDDPKYYCFSYRDRKYDKWDHFDEKALWNEPDHYWNTPGGNSAIFCLQFCLLAGVKKIAMIGCDCCGLNRWDYVQDKRRRRVKHDYESYARGTMRLIHDARDRFGVPVVQINPFAGIGREPAQFEEMKTWK